MGLYHLSPGLTPANGTACLPSPAHPDPSPRLLCLEFFTGSPLSTGHSLKAQRVVQGLCRCGLLSTPHCSHGAYGECRDLSTPAHFCMDSNVDTDAALFKGVLMVQPQNMIMIEKHSPSTTKKFPVTRFCFYFCFCFFSCYPWTF